MHFQKWELKIKEVILSFLLILVPGKAKKVLAADAFSHLFKCVLLRKLEIMKPHLKKGIFSYIVFCPFINHSLMKEDKL
jgi:hypothetical protein